MPSADTMERPAAMTDDEREIRQRLKDDFAHYAPRCLRIRTKSGKMQAFALNRAQSYLHEKLEEQLARTGQVRALVLKGRQQGVSTYIGGRFYHKTTHRRGNRTFILTHEQDATDNLFDMVDRYHSNCPELVRPTTGAANAKELTFPLLDSGYQVGTAGSKAVGRSNTLQMFHGSEVAFWPNASAHFAGVVQAVADEPGTEIILESTANGVGGEFHSRWQQSEAGIGKYIAVFIPWYWDDGYQSDATGFVPTDEELEYARLYGLSNEQLAWRRNKIAELNDPVLFKQEYPATAAEAFQMSGHDGLIKPEIVVEARKNSLEGVGPLVIGVDPKREGTDRFAIARRKGRKLISVESDASPIETMAAAAKLKDIIDRENPARMFIDVGGNGAGIADVLHSWGEKYRKIVVLVNFGSAPFHPPERDKDGKEMAGYLNRRAEMWGLSRDWLKQPGGADIPDSDSLQVDACAPGYHYHPVSQKLVLESKEHIQKVRKLRSPDEWDAVALTFAEPVDEERERDSAPRSYVGGPTGWMGC